MKREKSSNRTKKEGNVQVGGGIFCSCPDIRVVGSLRPSIFGKVYVAMDLPAGWYSLL
jgi:hypothetical protein